jgi:iron(III) transport system substrate-binding protein
MHTIRRLPAVAALAALALGATACGDDDATDPAETEPEGGDTPAADEPADGAAGGPLTIYSGRAEELVGGVIDGFTDATGIEVEVRYGDTAEMAAQIVAEGDASPADVFWSQDPGALGALEAEGILTTLPDDITGQVTPAFVSDSGAWVGVTGRVRVLTYNTDNLSEDELPDSVLELTEPEWAGRVSWAPTNGSFQAFVTALRLNEGEEVARDWLEGMIANDVQVFENNGSQVEAVGRGEVDVALVNHYYLLRYLAEDPDFSGANHYLPGDIGGLMMPAGVGVLATSDQPTEAEQFVSYLLSEDVQNYFGTETAEREFPAVDGIDPTDLPSVTELDPPDVDLSGLADLQGTIDLLNEVGAIQ